MGKKQLIKPLQSPIVIGTKVLIEVILCNTLVLLFSPIIILVLACVLSYRFGVYCYLKIFHGDNIKLMSPTSSFWCVNKKIETNYFLYLQIIEGEFVSLEQVQKMTLHRETSAVDEKTFNAMFSHLVNFRCIKKLGFFCWELIKGDSSKQIKFLVKDKERIYLPMNQETLYEEIQNFYDDPIDENNAQCEIYVVPNFVCEHSQSTGKKCYVLIYRIHHAVMDGLSATNSIVNHGLADKPVKLAVDPLKPLNISRLKWVLIHINMAIFGPRVMYKAIVSQDKNCFHNHKNNIGEKTFAWSRAIDLNAFKKIKNRTGTSITSIIIASVGGALRRLALKKGFPVPDSIHSLVTVAILPYKDLIPTNRFSVAHLPIEIGKDSVPSRLKSAQKSMDHLANSVAMLWNFYMMNVVGMLPWRAIELITKSADATFCLTNSPGPLEKMNFMGGNTLVDFIAWNVIKNSIGLGVTVTTYNGRVRAAIFGDKAVMPNKRDIPDLIKQFENEVTDLARYAKVPVEAVFL